MPEERKLVTILFADVTGSTALGGDLDPEDVRALMGRYYDHARQVVSGHGGTLEKFIGDAVMVVFGLPHAHGDDAERAVAAALALREAVDKDTVLREQVTLRIGVNTGEVVATSDPSSGDFLVTGDAVNVAARLRQCADPAEILTSERTHAATEAAFVFGDGREVEVKGKREPLRVFPVLGVRPMRLVERPPLVGRKRELAHLSMLQSWTLDEHRPQLVSIVAPAGTGKTRLLEEFLSRLDPDEGWRVAVGRCLPYGQALTYWPLRGLLEDLVGEINRGQMVDAWLRGGFREDDATRLADLVLAPLGIKSETLTERESIFDAWRLLSETLAKDTPRIVVFEDLHWASDSLLDLVEHIMHPRTKAPLLIIAISRPELLDRRPMWGGGGRQNFTALVLEPLNQAQTTQLVERLAGDLPHGIQERIVERSGGNPFFATELVRGLEERGISELVDGTDIVPDTVHAAVLARLDALSPVERRVVQAASVAGRAFHPAALAAVVQNLEPIEINAAVEGLLARDLAVAGEGNTYTFRHALIRDVAYGTLSRAERIRMHAAVAAWLEQFAADRLDEFIELVAYHYREAVVLWQRSAVALSLPFHAAKAVDFLERAGELASRAGAIAEARSHLQSALNIAPAADHTRLYEKLGDCAAWGPLSMDAYREALERWRGEDTPDRRVGARLLRKMLLIHVPNSGIPEPGPGELTAMQVEAQQLADASADEDEQWRVRVVKVYGLEWRATGRRNVEWENDIAEEAVEGRGTAQRTAEHFQERGDWESLSMALGAYTLACFQTGAIDDAIAAAQRRLTVPDLPSRERGDALGAIAFGHFYRGDYAQTLAEGTKVLEKMQPGDSVVNVSDTISLAAQAAFLGGYWSDLRAFMDAIEESRYQFREDASLAFFRPPYFAAMCVALGREDRTGFDAASSAFERILLALGMDPNAPGTFAAYRDDDPQRLDLSPSLSNWYDMSLTLMFLAERDMVTPSPFLESAKRMLRTNQFDWLTRCTAVADAVTAQNPVQLQLAIDDAEQHGLIPHAARMRIVLAQKTGDPAVLEQARLVLDRLEDRQFLRRLEEVAASLRLRIEGAPHRTEPSR